MREESATPDLVELTRRAIESAGAWAADPGRSPDGLDALLSFYGPDSVWDMSLARMGVLKGPAAISSFFEDRMGAYEEYEFELEEINDLGGGVILAVAYIRGRLLGSTAHVDLRWATTTEWADGRIARVTAFTDIDEVRAVAERRAEERGCDV